MLYGVNPTDISILTHKFSPTSEKNGFKQSGNVASLKYGTLFSVPEPDDNLGTSLTHFITALPISGMVPRSLPIVPVVAPTPVVTINPPAPIAGNSGPIFTTQPISVAPPPPSFKYGTSSDFVVPSRFASSQFDPKNGYRPSTFVGRFRGNLGDDDLTLGSLFSKAVKSVVSNPVQAAVKVATKVATGGLTLITDTGVLGKDAQKIGQRADVVAAGALGGAVAGAVTGGVPGVFAGAVAGGTKGLVDATATSHPNTVDTTRTLYQGAAYGAAAGGVARAVNAGISSYQQAQIAKSAAEAEQAGYGAAADTAHAASAEAASAAGNGAASTTAAATKTAASTLLSSSVKSAAEIAGLKLLLGGGGGNPLVLPGASGDGSAQPIYIPGSGSDGGAYSYPMGTTNTSLPANDGGLTPLPVAPLASSPTLLGMPSNMVYAGLAVGAAILLLKRRKAA